MNIPKSITMAGIRVRIKFRDLGDDDCYGIYSHRRKLITIDKTLKGKELLETIRHEMIHAALGISGLAFCEAYEEEAIVRCMDEIFFPAWERLLKRFNPQ
jgi:hypothetical protein|tara:strand:+ start:1059 stop:1358 length:300 start_codon:yes stop_codon:yes gene_type:complete